VASSPEKIILKRKM